MTQDGKKPAPAELPDAAVDAVAAAGHELVHTVQQNQTAQFNPKELTVDKSVPWQRNGG